MVGVWACMVLMAVIQAPVLFKKKKWKELIAFGVFWLVAGIYASLIFGTYSGRVEITNVTELLIRFFSTIYD
ncbi:MAG: hypothetical protein ACOX15_09220 [Tepidanaerobacteraceae bacterium]|jgi:hypothetical protein